MPTRLPHSSSSRFTRISPSESSPASWGFSTFAARPWSALHDTPCGGCTSQAGEAWAGRCLGAVEKKARELRVLQAALTLEVQENNHVALELYRGFPGSRAASTIIRLPEPYCSGRKKL